MLHEILFVIILNNIIRIRLFSKNVTHSIFFFYFIRVNKQTYSVCARAQHLRNTLRRWFWTKLINRRKTSNTILSTRNIMQYNCSIIERNLIPTQTDEEWTTNETRGKNRVFSHLDHFDKDRFRTRVLYAHYMYPNIKSNFFLLC